jgi:hypothetical protein
MKKIQIFIEGGKVSDVEVPDEIMNQLDYIEIIDFDTQGVEENELSEHQGKSCTIHYIY